MESDAETNERTGLVSNEEGIFLSKPQFRTNIPENIKEIAI